MNISLWNHYVICIESTASHFNRLLIIVTRRKCAYTEGVSHIYNYAPDRIRLILVEHYVTTAITQN